MTKNNGNNIYCKCDRNLLKIVKKMIGAIVENKNILQEVVEELALILDVERCVTFKIYQGESKVCLCKIVAGTPIDGHKIGLKDPLSEHHDLEMVFKSKELELIKDPLVNPHTRYFKDIIKEKKINQILYIPLITSAKVEVVRGVIVIDVLGEGIFSEDEISFCRCIGELISMTINREEYLKQKWKDRILNPAVSLGGFARHVVEDARKIGEAAKIIIDSTDKIEEQFKEDSKNTSF